MVKLLFIVAMLISLQSSSQSLLIDTSMYKALSPGGYKNANREFKDFNAKGSNGKIYTIDSLKGKVSFLNFWFESCAPCIAEFDALNALYQKYKNNKEFLFLSFTFESPEAIDRIIKQYHLEYPILRLEREDIYRLIFNLGFPTNMITGKSVVVRFIKCGGATLKEKVQVEFESIYSDEIEKLLFPEQRK